MTVRGDYSRLTFDPRRHYTGVLRQQGRVDLDADWNEQVDIQRHYRRLLALDLIGPCGGPIDAGGFKIVATRAGRELRIGPGRYYVGGLLAENEEECTFEAQPDLSESQREWLTRPPRAGAYRAHLQVWERDVSHLDDPRLVEPALGGTGLRLQLAWQVRLCTVTDANDCCPRSERRKEPSGSLSVLPSERGYTGLENRLYRVEIHDGGQLGSATFKWSRANASDAHAITSAEGAVLTIASTAANTWRPLRVGQWAEVIDRAREADALSGHLYQVDSADEATGSVTLATDSERPAPASVIDLTRRPKLQAWDHRDGDARGQATGGAEIELEDGIAVSFGPGAYDSGDYWLIPARAGNGNIGLPGQAQAEPAMWVPRYCCPLADLKLDSRGRWRVRDDLRSVFSPLSAT